VVSQGVHRRENRPASTSPIAGGEVILNTGSIYLGDGPEGEAKVLIRLSRVPLGALLKPEELSRAPLNLVFDDSAGITGITHIVDGGLLSAAEFDLPV
jgi:hypothetical protein